MSNLLVQYFQVFVLQFVRVLICILKAMTCLFTRNCYRASNSYSALQDIRI